MPDRTAVTLRADPWYTHQDAERLRKFADLDAAPVGGPVRVTGTFFEPRAGVFRTVWIAPETRPTGAEVANLLGMAHLDPEVVIYRIPSAVSDPGVELFVPTALDAKAESKLGSR
ncbi:MAG: hypothetical protein ACKVVT_05870 [Dehalococcoidia bacterium]